MNPSILRKKFLNPSIFLRKSKTKFKIPRISAVFIVYCHKYGTHWFKSLTEPLYHVNSQYPPFYCWMCKWKWLKKTDWRKNYECFSDNSCNSIRKKLIMTQLIYGSCIYQTTYYWWPQARMGVFYCVCKVLPNFKKWLRVLEIVCWDEQVCWC